MNNAFLFDLRDAWRSLRRDRAYAAIVVLTLALTLGATTAVFSIVNGVLLKPLAYRESQRLVSIREVLLPLVDQYPTLPVNARHFDQWREHATSFASMAELDLRTANLTGVGEPAQVTVLRASGTLFDVLQWPVALGRPLTGDDEREDRPAVAIVSAGFWHDRLGSDPAVIGRSLTLGGRQYTVVGVLPPGVEIPSFDPLAGFRSLTSRFDVILPLRIDLTKVDWMGMFNNPVIARLQPGVTLDQARAELNVLQDAVAARAVQEAKSDPDIRGFASGLRASIVPLDEAIVGRARAGLLVLLAAIVGVVLIACSNLANLSLSRTLARARDAAIRAALGADRGRLVRHVVLEQLVLAVAGGAIGLLVARAALDAFVRTAPIDLPRVHDVAIDARVLVFAGGLALVAGVVVALLPAWRTARRDVEAVLRTGGYASTDRGGRRARSVLLGAQVALAVMLLVVTGLLVASFDRLMHVDVGFTPAGVVAIDVSPSPSRYADTAARAALYDRVLDRVRPLPGVTSAAFTSALPLTGETWVDVVSRPDDKRPMSRKPSANYRFVTPDYFRAIGAPIVRGRSFEERERNSAIVPVVVSARAARTVWPGQDAVGQRFTRGGPESTYEIVGVVSDGHVTQLDAEPPLMVYAPYWSNNEGKSTLVVRTAADPRDVVAAVRRTVAGVDPELVIADVTPMQQLVDRSLEGRRYQMWLFVAFGAVALLIATIGVYAVTSYGVSRRRREMNLRVALGAQTSQVFALVVRQGLAAVAAGVAVGIGGALAAGAIVANLLFEVRARDPLVLSAVAAIVVGVAMLAASVAARNGLAIDPAAALREE